MPSQFNRIGLWGRFADGSVSELAAQLSSHLAKRKLKVFAPRNLAAPARSRGVRLVPPERLGKSIDLLVAIGGDGNLLRATRVIAGCGVPIIGVNRGRLGFLTDVLPDDMIANVDDVLAGRYETDRRQLLQARLAHEDGTARAYLALNDVVVAKGALGRLIDLDVRADGEPMTAYRADGLIIATPTGSTAYNLSAAGPILFPTMDAVVLTPICSHTLTNRPIVLPASVHLEVTLQTATPDVVLSVDGQPGPPVGEGDVVRVRQASARIRLIRDPRKSYFEVLRTKLKWGER